MNKNEQRHIVEQIFESAKEEILNSKLPNFPEEWSGIHIRRYVAEYITLNYQVPMSGPMRRRFENDCIVSNL